MTDRIQWDGTRAGAEAVAKWLLDHARERERGSLGIVYDEDKGVLALPVPQLYKPNDPRWEIVEPGDWVMLSLFQSGVDQIAARVGRLQPQQLALEEVEDYQLWKELIRRHDRPFIEKVLDDFTRLDEEGGSGHDIREERRRLLLATFVAFAEEAGALEAWTDLMTARRRLLDTMEGPRP